MRFKGDIIITDPCYIVNSDEIEMPEDIKNSKPAPSDFLRYPCREEYPDLQTRSFDKLNFDDQAFFKSMKEICDELKEQSEEAAAMFEREFVAIMPKYSAMYEEDLDKYFAACDKWREPYLSDWDKCKYGEDMGVLGFTDFLCSQTYYGDWSCGVFSGKKRIGSFCADAGMVCVMLLDEVLKYNPDFNLHKTSPHACALIRDFDGDIVFNKQEDDGEIILTIVGSGNINFKTRQTGF